MSRQNESNNTNEPKPQNAGYKAGNRHGHKGGQGKTERAVKKAMKTDAHRSSRRVARVLLDNVVTGDVDPSEVEWGEV